MSATELDGWICPQCGQTNYYHPGRCSHCPDGRRTTSGSKLDQSPLVSRKQYSRPSELSEDARRKRITFLTLTCLTFVSWLYLFWEFHKWDAKWGSIHIGIPTLVATAVIGGWIYRRNWFQDRTNPTGWKFMIIPLAGFLLAASLGIYFTEPIERGGTVTHSRNSVGGGANTQTASQPSSDYQYDYSRSRASDVYFFSSLLDLGELAEGAGDTDEFCLVFLLVGLVILLIIGSAVIPHFWALSTFVLLVVMAMFTYREWRLVENL